MVMVVMMAVVAVVATMRTTEVARSLMTKIPISIVVAIVVCV